MESSILHKVSNTIARCKYCGYNNHKYVLHCANIKECGVNYICLHCAYHICTHSWPSTASKVLKKDITYDDSFLDQFSPSLHKYLKIFIIYHHMCGKNNNNDNSNKEKDSKFSFNFTVKDDILTMTIPEFTKTKLSQNITIDLAKQEIKRRGLDQPSWNQVVDLVAHTEVYSQVKSSHMIRQFEKYQNNLSLASYGAITICTLLIPAYTHLWYSDEYSWTEQWYLRDCLLFFQISGAIRIFTLVFGAMKACCLKLAPKSYWYDKTCFNIVDFSVRWATSIENFFIVSACFMALTKWDFFENFDRASTIALWLIVSSLSLFGLVFCCCCCAGGLL